MLKGFAVNANSLDPHAKSKYPVALTYVSNIFDELFKFKYI